MAPQIPLDGAQDLLIVIDHDDDRVFHVPLSIRVPRRAPSPRHPVTVQV